MNKLDLEKATLKDDAAIYNHGPELSDREKWAAMNGKQRLDFFKTYYLKYVILGLVGLALLAYIIYSIVKPKPAVLLKVAVNNFTSVDYTSVSKKYLEDHGLSEKEYELNIDGTYSLENDYYSSQRFATYVFAGDLDILICANATFEKYAENSFMFPLDELLDKELFDSLKDAGLIYYANEKERDINNNVISEGETRAYGLVLKNLTLYDGLSQDGYYPVLGVIQNTKNAENAAEFIKFLLEKYTKAGQG